MISKHQIGLTIVGMPLPSNQECVCDDESDYRGWTVYPICLLKNLTDKDTPLLVMELMDPWGGAEIRIRQYLTGGKEPFEWISIVGFPLE